MAAMRLNLWLSVTFFFIGSVLVIAQFSAPGTSLQKASSLEEYNYLKSSGVLP
jgi:hypothetical protein